MTPHARVQAAIEVLDQTLEHVPAEKALTSWARRSRFAGSKDRRAVRDLVYQALRCRGTYADFGGSLSGRGLMIGKLRADGVAVEEMFNGTGYGPDPLSADEAASSENLLDPQVQWNMPDWVIGHFKTSLGDQALRTAEALSERAPTMLRVNIRKTTVDTVAEKLLNEGIATTTHPIAPTALLVTGGNQHLAASPPYQTGLVEVQDGSSQAAMQMLDIPKGARVLDYCAGGGGKTLALAARAEAQWFVHDALPHRMKDIPARAVRAGVTTTIFDGVTLPEDRPFDMVLCDAPCSGSGTWRRTPDAKWALTPTRLDELVSLQAQILDEAAGLLGAGGQLIYATCSVFKQENQDQINAFIARNPDWSLAFSHSWNVSDGGDGFFVAQLFAAI